MLESYHQGFLYNWSQEGMKPQIFLISPGNSYVQPGLRPTYLDTLQILLSHQISFNFFKFFHPHFFALCLPNKTSTSIKCKLLSISPSKYFSSSSSTHFPSYQHSPSSSSVWVLHSFPAAISFSMMAIFKFLFQASNRI